MFVEAQFIISKMGRFEVIFRQFPDTMLTISATMLTRRAMVFFVSEFAYCALGTGPITGVQQVSIWFHFLLIPFGLLDVTPFVAMRIIYLFPIGSSV